MADRLLIVEGKDDQNALIHLLKRHGLDYDQRQSHPELPTVEVAEDVVRLIERIPLAVRLSDDRPIGFVVDADDDPAARWTAVRSRLSLVEVVSPDAMVPEGFVGRSTSFQTDVGVWMMPDNSNAGALEEFLRTLIAEADPLIGHASTSTTAARGLGAKFPRAAERKAVLHAWLAWQQEPGCPYGTAIMARYFAHESDAALRFVAWFRRLYSL